MNSKFGIEYALQGKSGGPIHSEGFHGLWGGTLKVSGLSDVKDKRRKRIGRFKNRTVQEDIDRCGEALKQRELRRQHDEERKRLKSRELREKVRARFIATEEKRKAPCSEDCG